MKSVSSLTELDCSFLRLTYLEWLAIREPLFFSFMEITTTKEDHCLTLHNPSYLSAYSAWVALVRVGDNLYKLNGKQRKEAWSTGKIQPPENLSAQVFDISEAIFLALNADAQKLQLDQLPPNDTVKLAVADLGLNFTSERLKSGFINEAINIALRGKQRALQDKRSAREKQDIDIKKAITVFSQELMLIDHLNPKPEIFVTGVLSGALIMLGLNKDIREFLVRLSEQRGEIIEDSHDPVSCLLGAIHSYSFRMTQKLMKARMSIDLCKKTIQAILLWEKGPESPRYWRKKDLTGVDHLPYIRELKQLKGINENRDL